MSQIKSLSQLEDALTIATAAEAAARAKYDALEGAVNPDHAAIASAQDALGDAVLAEDQARAALDAALAADDSTAGNHATVMNCARSAREWNDSLQRALADSVSETHDTFGAPEALEFGDGSTLRLNHADRVAAATVRVAA